MALFVGIYCPVKSIVTWGGVSDMFLTYEERKDLRRMIKRVIGELLLNIQTDMKKELRFIN